MLKSLTTIIAIAVVVLIAASAGLAPAQAQDLPAKATGVSVVAGDRPDQVTISWQAGDGATLYRIGWVAFDKIAAVQNANRPWLDAFAFTDVTNYGQTSHLLDGLLPGVQCAFIIGSPNSRFDAAAWSEWTYLTTAAAAARCPDGGGNPPQPRVPTTTPTPSATATPTPTTTPDPDATPTPTPDLNATPTTTPEPGPTPTPTPAPTPVGTDCDTDSDGLIEIKNWAQLDAVRHNLDGDGAVIHATVYTAAFPNAKPNMGCFRNRCLGYELVADLDFDTNGDGHIDEGDTYWDDGNGWYPIGDTEQALRYSAVLEGNGHTIANLYIDWTDTTRIGLFRAINRNAVIRNLGLTSVHINGSIYVGALAGVSYGTISNSHAEGEVSGAWTGGLVGVNYGSIVSSRSSAAVSGGYWTGGLVGSNSGSIADSYATGNVTGNGNIGGLVGIIDDDGDGSISGSYATGSVTGAGYNIGGLVGYSAGAITASYATGIVTGALFTVPREGGNVGGLVGYSTGTITASHATGDVTSEGNAVGGLVGDSRAAITASYATGNVASEGFNTGGLVGYCGKRLDHNHRAISLCSITASYAAGNASGKGPVGGLAGRITGGDHRNVERVALRYNYAIGHVSGDNDNYVGGLIGLRGDIGHRNADTHSYIQSSYWDQQTTGQSSSSGGTGKTTREMQRPTGPTGIYAGWDPEYWDFGTSQQYPVLKYRGMDVTTQRR